MKAIQDGYMESIQDGKLEGQLPEIKGKSIVGLIYVVSENTNPQVTAIVDTHFTTNIVNATITTLLGTVVT